MSQRLSRSAKKWSAARIRRCHKMPASSLELSGSINGYGSKQNHKRTACLSLWFHLPGFHFRYAFLTHSQIVEQSFTARAQNRSGRAKSPVWGPSNCAMASSVAHAAPRTTIGSSSPTSPDCLGITKFSYHQPCSLQVKRVVFLGYSSGKCTYYVR